MKDIKIIDLTVGQLFEALEVMNLELKKSKKIGRTNEKEKELINLFFKVSQSDSAEEMTATQIKKYIQSQTGEKITDIQRFGSALKIIFGPSKMKRGFGFVYKVSYLK